MPKSKKAPSLTYYAPRQCGRVRINKKDHYITGVPFGSPECMQEYARLLAEHWIDSIGTSTARVPDSRKVWPSVDDLIARYMTKHVPTFYVDRDGKPSDRQYHIRIALRPLHELYGNTPVNEFGSKRFKLVREKMIADGTKEGTGYTRGYVNNHVSIIKNLFRWGVEEELVPVEVHQALLAVQQLRKGREVRVREYGKIPPVAKEIVDATLPHLPPQLATMATLQLHTAMRPDEVTIMRKCDIDFSDEVWTYVPQAHKTEHHDLSRKIYLGPACQAELAPWLDRPDDTYLFSPREVVAALRARRRKTPSQKPEKFKYDRSPRECYDDETYCRAVKRGCLRAEVPVWTPNQLRHTAATFIRETYGLEAAKIILGHHSAVTTEIYAEKDAKIAKNIMREIG